MSYLVLARKWRPRCFEEVTGQDSIIRTLKNSIERKRIHHALLFTGMRGVGKTTIARIYAKALNCENGPTVTMCNKCANCTEIFSGSSMDVLEIDGASNTSVNDVRELRENVRYLPSKSRYKIYIIDEVHMLSQSAFNALLKTLEEPPQNVVFMFATTEPDNIPQTIISRCQRFDLKPIPVDKIVESLRKICSEEKFSISDYSLEIVSREAKGSMRDALSILDKLIAYGGNKIGEEEIVEILGLVKRDVLTKTAKCIIGKESRELLMLVDHVFKEGYDPRIFLSELLEYFRNLLVLKVDESAPVVDTPLNEINDMVTIAQRVSIEELEFIFDIVKSAALEVAKTDYQRFVVELALLRAASAAPLAKINDVITELQGLEDELAEATKGSSTNPGRVSGSESQPKKKFEGVRKFRFSNSNLETEWPRIVRHVKSLKPYLGVILEKATVALDGGSLRIGFKGSPFNIEKISEPESVGFLGAVIQELYSESPPIEVIEEGTPSGLEPSTRECGASEKKIAGDKTEIEASRAGNGKASAVKKALDILGGRIDGETFKDR